MSLLHDLDALFHYPPFQRIQERLASPDRDATMFITAVYRRLLEKGVQNPSEATQIVLQNASLRSKLVKQYLGGIENTHQHVDRYCPAILPSAQHDNLHTSQNDLDLLVWEEKSHHMPATLQESQR
jgi:hypothetical protein